MKKYSFNTRFKHIALVLFSRPLFFNFFHNLTKLCLIAMNRTAATDLLPKDSGEAYALKFALKKLQTTEKICIFDVGGNCGDYMEMVWEICKDLNFNLFVFEPSSKCFKTLKTKISDNQDTKIYQLALSNKDGVEQLFFPWDGSSGASLANLDCYNVYIPNAIVQKESIMSTTLDNFCRDNKIEGIDFLKLDIEGFELFAIEGAEEMIRNRKIAFIQIEIGAASITTKFILFDFWKKLHEVYNFYLILNQGLIPIKRYEFDMESFYGASNFLLELKPSSLQSADKIPPMALNDHQ